MNLLAEKKKYEKIALQNIFIMQEMRFILIREKLSNILDKIDYVLIIMILKNTKMN